MSDSAAAALRTLLTPEAVRERCEELWRLGQADALAHFRLHEAALDDVARYVLDETRRNYPDLRVPVHSRWRHFELGGRDRWLELAPAATPEELARVRFDLAVVSVLLDAGAGPRWRFRDPHTGLVLGRSEGLALASLRLFASGALGRADGHGPPRVDAEVLAALAPAELAAAMQSRDDNPLLGVAERCRLLNRLGEVLLAQPAWFRRGDAVRPGHLFDVLAGRAREAHLPAREILVALLETLGDIWPRGCRLAGVPLGDVGRHPGIRRDDASDGLVPFHKLSQWLAYSLLEPLEEAGVRVTEPDALTGLPEYRNGGLLLDMGVLALRDPDEAGCRQDLTGELVVEWRALTVAALDRIAARIRDMLGLDAAALPLASVLQGGTWSAGRCIAAARRPGGGPPLDLATDGTLF